MASKVISHVRLCVLLLSCLSLTSCVESTKPLSNPDTCQGDDRLDGVWTRTDDLGETLVVVDAVTAHEKVDLGFPAGMRRAVLITRGKNGMGAPSVYLFFPTKIGDDSYLNFLHLAGDNDTALRTGTLKWTAEIRNSHYAFYKYEVKAGNLVLYKGDQAAVRQAIQAGKIGGTVGEGLVVDSLTDSTENLVKFLASGGCSIFVRQGDEFKKLED